MAARNPLLIVKEYLELGEPPQVRKNALSALAGLADPVGLATLAEVAMSDPDDQVRDRAEREMASLPATLAGPALERVFNDLTNPSTRGAAYALLGRLRSLGLRFQLPQLKLWTRLILIRALRDDRYRDRGARFLFRGLGGASLGLLLAAFPLFAYLKATLGLTFSSDYFGMVFAYYLVTWLIMLLVSMMATRFSSPIAYHADVAGAVFVDAAMAALTGAVGAGVSMFLNRASMPSWEGYYFVLGLVPAAAVAVRAGTVTAHGLVQRKKPNFVIQVIVGGLAGLAVYEGIAIVSGMMAVPLVSLSWMWVAMTAFGLAGVYARIDREAPPRPVVSTPVRVLIFALVSVVLGVAVVSLIPLRPADSIGLTPDQIAALPTKLELRNVPVTLRSTVDLPVRITVDNPVSYRVNQTTIASGGWEAQIARQADVKTTDLTDPIAQLAKVLTWPQLKARIRRTQPDGGAPFVTVTIERLETSEGREGNRPQAFR